MKKIKYLIIVLSFLSFELATAQSKSIAKREPDWNATTTTSFTTVSEAKNYVAEILSVLGLKANFELRASDVPNAAAVIYGGKRYVMYNPTFINTLNKAAGNKWAAISILAHEIGHHLNGHTLDNIGSNPPIELEADEFSGFVLRRMGASLEEAQQAMRIAADYKQSATHPGKYDRLVSIAKGWNSADIQMVGKRADIAKTTTTTTTTKPSPPAKGNTDIRTTTRANDIATKTGSIKDDPRRASPRTSGTYGDNREDDNGNYSTGTVPAARTVSQRSMIDERQIIGDVSFTSDPDASFYITTRYNLVKVVGGQLYILGKINSSTSKAYPYIVTLSNTQKLYVSARGNILTKDGYKVGEMSSR